MKTSLKFSERQRGAVLLVGLVMLVMVTLLAISGFNMVKINQQVAGNMESRGQAMVAANAAIEEAISSTLFLSSPDNLLLNACGSSNSRCYDVNDDGVNDITVVVRRPTCVTVTPKTNDEVLGIAEALLAQAEDVSDIQLKNQLIKSAYGFTSCQSQHGASGRPAGSTNALAASECSIVIWNFEAYAEDDVTGARASVRQGVSVWSPKNDVESVCPLSDEEA